MKFNKNSFENEISNTLRSIYGLANQVQAIEINSSLGAWETDVLPRGFKPDVDHRFIVSITIGNKPGLNFTTNPLYVYDDMTSNEYANFCINILDDFAGFVNRKIFFAV